MRLYIFTEHTSGNLTLEMENWDSKEQVIEYFNLTPEITGVTKARGWGKIKTIEWHGPIGFGIL